MDLPAALAMRSLKISGSLRNRLQTTMSAGTVPRAVGPCSSRLAVPTRDPDSASAARSVVASDFIGDASVAVQVHVWPSS
jgi:hypothetical protein